jgi:hypothetical protein
MPAKSVTSTRQSGCDCKTAPICVRDTATLTCELCMAETKALHLQRGPSGRASEICCKCNKLWLVFLIYYLNQKKLIIHK